MVTLYGRKTVAKNWQVSDGTLTGFIRIYFVYGGKVIYNDEETELSLKPGRLYFFPTNRIYRMRQEENYPLQCLYLHLDVTPDTVDQVWEIVPDRFLDYFLNALEDTVLQNNQKLISSMADTLRSYALQKKIIVKPDPRLSEVLTYITRHLAEPMNVEELSRMAGYNQQYFIRLFKRATGVSPYQYIIHCRMKEAARLLQQDFSVSQAAELVGYPDVKSFARAFKAQFSTSPTTWKKECELLP